MGNGHAQDPEILSAIQAAEEKIDRMLRDAQTECRQKIEAARRDAERLLSDARRKAEQMAKSSVASAASQAEADANDLIRRVREEIGVMKTRNVSRLDEAARRVLVRLYPELRLDGEP